MVVASTFGAPSLSTWYNLDAYYDAVANEIGLKVNDGAYDTLGSVLGPNNTGNPFAIGRSLTGAGYQDGRTDLFRFWTRTKTAQEVTDLYGTGSALAYSAF